MNRDELRGIQKITERRDGFLLIRIQEAIPLDEDAKLPAVEICFQPLDQEMRTVEEPKPSLVRLNGITARELRDALCELLHP